MEDLAVVCFCTSNHSTVPNNLTSFLSADAFAEALKGKSQEQLIAMIMVYRKDNQDMVNFLKRICKQLGASSKRLKSESIVMQLLTGVFAKAAKEGKAPAEDLPAVQLIVTLERVYIHVAGRIVPIFRIGIWGRFLFHPQDIIVIGGGLALTNRQERSRIVVKKLIGPGLSSRPNKEVLSDGDFKALKATISDLKATSSLPSGVADVVSKIFSGGGGRITLLNFHGMLEAGADI